MSKNHREIPSKSTGKVRGPMNNHMRQGQGPNKASGHKGGMGRQGSKRG